MKILLTGATGFIGKNLIRELEKNNELHILVRPESNWDELGIKHVFEFSNNIPYLIEYLKSNQIDGIVHLASLYITEHKPEDIKDLILSNIYLGTALLEASSLAGIKWFLNTGTIWQNYNVADYSDEYNPVNLYAATKQAFITISKFYTETSNLRFSTLKLCDTYGPNDTRRKILSLFKQISITGEVLNMSPGEQLIDIVHVDKVIESFITLINILADKDKEFRKEYVVTSGEQIKLKDLALRYEKENNVTLNINWGGRNYRKREVMRPYRGNKI